MYIDETDLIVTSTGDGGDTAQNEGMFGITCVNKVSNYNAIIGKLEPKGDGIWVRHPIQYPNPKDFSRDQATSNIIAMGLFGFKAALNRMALAQVKRFGLYQNGDLLLPDNIGQFIRAFNWKFLYLFLWFSDIFMVINTLIICFIKARRPGPIQKWLGQHVHWIFIQGEPDNAEGVPQDIYGMFNVGTDKNHIASLYQAQQVMPTLISLLARKLYKRFRRSYKNDPMFPMPPDSVSGYGPQYALDIYYRTDNIEIAQSWVKNLENF